MSARSILAWVLLGASVVAQELTIAAASDLQAALPEVVAAYENKTGKKVRVTFGSSGNFYAQIQNGAPFDLFFSADLDYPRRLESAGLTRSGSLYLYATGQIVVWVPHGSRLDLTRLGLKTLLDPNVKRIAIANPAHAPYGRAAQAALERVGIYEQVRSKLVTGENISQAAQFVQSGNAQAGIIALALALSPRMTSAGAYWIVPQELYPRLEQGVVILKATKHAEDAQAFLEFLKSEPAVAVMKRFGFIPPGQTERKR